MTRESGSPVAASASISPQRRRIHLMRHGAVDYFRADGRAVPPEGVALNDRGRAQADAAGRLFAEHGVRFDRVVTSGLARTRETAARVLAAAGQAAPVEAVAAFEEIRPGRLADLPADRIEDAFTGAFRARDDIEAQRFLGGESVGELLDRVLPAFQALLDDPQWSELLLVLHGGVNRALISRALAGRRAFFGGLEQLPACINLIDCGPDDLVVRAVNLAPTQWLQRDERLTTLEKLYAEYRRYVR
jgi:probable phosphoglycerate mutase